MAKTETSLRELRAVSGRRVIGASVVNLEDKNLGEIHDLAIDWGAGCIAYAVLASSTFLGRNRKLFAIPWEALAFKPGEDFAKGSRTLVLNIPEKALKESEGFDESNWPTAPDYAWLKEVYARYGFKPYWETRQQ